MNAQGTLHSTNGMAHQQSRVVRRRTSAAVLPPSRQGALASPQLYLFPVGPSHSAVVLPLFLSLFPSVSVSVSLSPSPSLSPSLSLCLSSPPSVSLSVSRSLSLSVSV